MKIIRGKNGIYTEFETDLFKGIRQINYDPDGEEVKEKINSKVGKIPANIFQLAIILLQKLCKIYDSEFMITINFDPKAKKWYIDVPEQRVSTTSVDFKLDPKKYSHIFIEIHTHPNEGSTTFSLTDNQDQTKMRYYGVIGKLTLNDPFRKSVSFDEIVELPDQKELNNLIELAQKNIKQKQYNSDLRHFSYNSLESEDRIYFGDDIDQYYKDFKDF